MEEKTRSEVIEAVEAITNEAERMRYAYFWEPERSAAGRRSYEKKHSHKQVEWNEGSHSYFARYLVICSCKHIYARGYYYKDGTRTNLTAIKNSLNRMKAEEAV